MASPLHAAKIESVGVVDKDYLVVHVLDGEVTFTATDQQTVTRFDPALNTAAAVQTANWTLKSATDGNYGSAGRHPLSCYRKTKLSGHAQMEWSGSDYRYEYTYQHWIFLKLPSSLQQGASYTLEIAGTTNSDRSSQALTFDVYNSRSEAVHVNLVGYAPDAPRKAADLYAWMGDGGARDYSSFEGNSVYLYDVASGTASVIGMVTYGKPGGSDVGGYDLTRSAVWNADFPNQAAPGTYRLVIDGVGCSQDFRIASDVYSDPFRVSLRGFYYMRVGQDNAANLQPPARTPLYLPGTSPANTVVYLTTMQPWHPQWSTFTGGDPWDNPNDWAAFRKSGNPTNPNAWGGHADAYDWDRHLGHVSIVYDMLLPYILTGGAIRDDATGIAESGNGIPDLLDEARNEVDFWLRLRDGAGYSHGLTNPNSNNELFQAGTNAMAAWANAANAAMLADAFRLAGQTTLMNTYRDAAITAYSYASGLADPMLDATQNIGEGSIRGRDLRMTAAAFLYDVTGTASYETAVNADSVCASGTAELENGSRNQIWGTAAYLRTSQPVHYPALWNNMKASVIAEAHTKEADLIHSRPSRRATDNRTGYFRTIQNVQRTMIAHAVTSDQAEKDFFREALALEADWGLGRNPLNLIQMTTAFTPLEAKRSIVDMYTSGRSDGVRALHPGHTPYLNLDDWYSGMTMGRPSALYENGYPANFKSTWPIDEGYFDSRWVWAHSEFTPQQAMRGKMALYGYLYGIGGAPATATLSVAKAGSGSGTVTAAGINCGSDCSETYASGTSVTLTASAASGSGFAGWGGACSGTGACTLTVSANAAVTATFDTAVVVASRCTYPSSASCEWPIGSSGTTRIQAENYDSGGQGTAYNDTDSVNSGGQYRTSEGVDIETTADAGAGSNVGWAAPGEWLEYTVNVAVAGTYDLKLRVARQPAGTSAVRVLFGGVDKTGDLVVPSTGAWQTWTDLVKAGVSLPAGKQLLRVAMVGGEFNLNWIEITPAVTPRTTYGNNGNAWAVSASATTRIQAENYDSGGEGVAYHDSDAANSGGQYRTSDGVDVETTAGGGYNVGWIVPGEWVEYTVNVAAAGSYDLKLRVARQPAGTSAVKVLFGGVDKTGDLVVPSTGGWQTWTDLTKTALSLSAGQQVLRLAMVGGDFNIDWIEIAPSATPSYPPSVGIYGDTLASDWSNWSWTATVDLNGSSPVKVGSNAANVTYAAGYGALSFHKGAPISTAGYSAIKFWVYGGTGANKALRVFVQASDAAAQSPVAMVTAVANTWTEISVPLSAVGSPTTLQRLSVQEDSGTAQPMLTFDEVRLVP